MTQISSKPGTNFSIALIAARRFLFAALAVAAVSLPTVAGSKVATKDIVDTAKTLNGQQVKI